MISLLIPLFIGVLAGTFTGLAPGIHINLVAAILLASLPKFQSILPIQAVIFIVSMSITHVFIDFIPSIFLGAPNEDNFLAVLPGHKLLKEGHGFQASILAMKGSFHGIILVLLITPIFIFALPPLFSIIKFAIPFILIFASLYLILRENNFLVGIIIFLLSGILGYTTFDLPVKEPLMPLLSGLFGLSAIIISLRESPQMQKQKILPLREIKLSPRDKLKSLISASIAAPLCSFLPGIGSGHAAVIGSEINEQNPRQFLFLVGAINIIVMSLSFVTAYAIQKTRTGSAAAVQQLLTQITLSNLLIILSAIIISGILAFILGINLSKLFSLFLNKINYKILNIIILLAVIIVNIIFTNWLGLLVLATSTALGIFAISSNSRRINLMGCLLIPSIIYYLIN